MSLSMRGMLPWGNVSGSRVGRGIAFAVVAGANAFAMTPHNLRTFVQLLGGRLRRGGSFVLIVMSV